MKKLGSGSRATFVSPYLRRPLRPLDKVLNELEERGDDSTSMASSQDGADETGSATWSLSGKSIAASD
ncbi:MAG: hypothetical protein ACFCUT_15800 [Kiloniellaceae bacterium]